MAPLTVRLDDETRDQLERLAQNRGTTVSAMLRGAIDGLLGRDVGLPGPDTGPAAIRSLSVLERHLLSLQHEILMRLDPAEAEHHEKRIRVLENGFTSEYHREFLLIEPEVSPAECALTMSILDMFTSLETAVDRADDDALRELGSGSEQLVFAGFDFNDSREARLATLAEHLISEGRWKSLAYHFDDEHENGNSHMPVLDHYQRMLTVYQEILGAREAVHGRGSLNAHLLDVDDLKTMLAGIRRPR
ncbi:YfbU family protein [Amycolatopsis japonica]